MFPDRESLYTLVNVWRLIGVFAVIGLAASIGAVAWSLWRLAALAGFVG